MNPAPRPGVTQLGYARCVTHAMWHLRSSEARGDSNEARYAIRRNTHPDARVRAQARAHTCAYMRVLRNYVTQKEEKKKQQVKASKTRYARRYVGVTCHVTGLASHRYALRAEVTHA